MDVVDVVRLRQNVDLCGALALRVGVGRRVDDLRLVHNHGVRVNRHVDVLVVGVGLRRLHGRRGGARGGGRGRRRGRGSWGRGLGGDGGGVHGGVSGRDGGRGTGG